MKAKIIEKIEEAFFELHPEVKPYYNIINLIKDLPYEVNYLQQTKLKTKRKLTDDLTSFINQPQSVAKVVRKPGINLQTRVLNTIGELGRFVRLSDILSKIKENDANFSASISPALTQLRQIGSLKNYMPTGNRKLTYWGLTEWEWKGDVKS
jgi:hypothetical protein